MKFLSISLALSLMCQLVYAETEILYDGDIERTTSEVYGGMKFSYTKKSPDLVHKGEIADELLILIMMNTWDYCEKQGKVPSDDTGYRQSDVERVVQFSCRDKNKYDEKPYFAKNYCKDFLSSPIIEEACGRSDFKRE
jgi:hypothetical protein